LHVDLRAASAPAAATRARLFQRTVIRCVSGSSSSSSSSSNTSACRTLKLPSPRCRATHDTARAYAASQHAPHSFRVFIVERTLMARMARTGYAHRGPHRSRTQTGTWGTRKSSLVCWVGLCCRDTGGSRAHSAPLKLRAPCVQLVVKTLHSLHIPPFTSLSPCSSPRCCCACATVLSPITASTHCRIVTVLRGIDQCLPSPRASRRTQSR